MYILYLLTNVIAQDEFIIFIIDYTHFHVDKLIPN